MWNSMFNNICLRSTLKYIQINIIIMQIAN